MSKVCIIFSCLIAAVAVRANQQTNDAILVNLYHNNLDFFDSFLSPGEIDGLLYLAENIPPETIKTLRNASISYSLMRGSLLSWCVEVNNTLAKSFNLDIDRDEFVTKMNRGINEMKTYFDSIVTEDHPPNTNTKTKNPSSVPGKSQGRANVTENITPASKSRNGDYSQTKTGQGANIVNISNIPSPERQKGQAYDTKNSAKTFENEMKHAKSLIDKAFEVILGFYGDKNKGIDIKATVRSCKPVLDKLATPPVEPPRYTLPPQTISPSQEETLKVYSRSCRDDRWYKFSNDKDLCEAYLSKSTMERFMKLYYLQNTVTGFFNAINSDGSTQECKDTMQSFITNSYMSWAYFVQHMERTKHLLISICLRSDRNVHIYIRD